LTAAVILAAGAGQRLGGVAKAMLRLDGGPTLLEAVITCAAAAGVSRCVVVVGPPHDVVTAAEARRLGAAVVHNPAPARGMASSVATGFGYLLASGSGGTAARTTGGTPKDTIAGTVAGMVADAIAGTVAGAVGLLWPVDHARVQPATVAAVARACAPDGAAVPTFQGRGGHPAGFGRALWPALAACTDAPQGARSVLRELAERAPGRVLRIAVDDRGVVADVDRPEDR
jgi:molybdenum cofactor cytidylyltransferase